MSAPKLEAWRGTVGFKRAERRARYVGGSVVTRWLSDGRIAHLVVQDGWRHRDGALLVHDRAGVATYVDTYDIAAWARGDGPDAVAVPAEVES